MSLGETGLDSLSCEDRAICGNTGQNDIAQWKQLVEFIEAVRGPAKSIGERFGMRPGPVGDATSTQAVVLESDQRGFDHVAGADDQRALVLEVFEDLLCQIDGDTRNGDRMLRDARLVLDAFGRRERPLIEPRQHRAASVGIRRLAIGILHLTQDLGFTHDH